MKIYYAGFNLYGQFIQCNETNVKKFTSAKYDDLIDLELNHSFAILHTQKGIVIHGENNSVSHQTYPLRFEKNVVGLSANEDMLLLLTENCGVHKLMFENFVITKIVDFLNVEDRMDGDRVVKVQCGNHFNVGLSEKGCLFSIPNKLLFKSTTVKDICVGREHCLILTENGSVYTFGRGSRGQLGHGDFDDHVEPKLIAALDGIKIQKIAAGGWHSAALSCEGDLYTWGWNTNGQLGLQTQSNESSEKVVASVIATPQVVDIEAVDDNVTLIACGHRHTVALLENNKLYGAGWNKYYQLGIDVGEQNLNSFTFLHDFVHKKIIKLKCGPWATAVLSESSS